MQLHDQVVEIIIPLCAHSEPVVNTSTTPVTLQVAPDDLRAVCQPLHEHPSLYFDMLSCVTGLDGGPDANFLEVIYTLYSIPFNHSLSLNVKVDRHTPVIPTVSDIWKTADWQEREVFDLYGISFRGHPDLRRILLPADWEGFPLRKDYKHQAYYRDIKVEY